KRRAKRRDKVATRYTRDGSLIQPQDITAFIAEGESRFVFVPIEVRERIDEKRVLLRVVNEVGNDSLEPAAFAQIGIKLLELPHVHELDVFLDRRGDLNRAVLRVLDSRLRRPGV